MAAAAVPAEADVARVLEVAVAAARKAGARMAAALGTAAAAAAETKASAQDLVTVVDKACQDDIEGAVLDAFGAPGEGGSGHHLLGEESVAAGSAASTAALDELLASEWLWVVDPIDGTTNFVQSAPLSVVSIGVAFRGEVVVGVIYDPYRNELFSAVRGQGAKLNGAPISVSSESSLTEAYMMFGIHSTARVRDPMLKAVTALSPRLRAVRCLGSAALHMAWTSCGRCSGFWELDLNAWDLAAGALLVAEAGGRVTDTRRGAYSLSTRDIMATNGAGGIHDALLDELEALSCDRPTP
ncbi:hypothetical protein FNF27_04079 [Cafeteria roenbergensis]|uniref:Inositol-1-monophosphatase n=1 Tax=Cafeteria roenbergensis TaxID=33653 RepID=A0A5A8D5H9_CAFRO|nr:hypothetical protein FNF31_04668 [Cafeteria roenbergensis]KAA0174483.1 hypothetical protein FNF27_04079 [Cafeteria roenbergensis]